MIESDGMSRRAFLGGVLASGAVAATMGLAGCAPQAKGDGSGNGQWVAGFVRWAWSREVGGAMGVGAANGWVGAEQ